MLSQRVKMRPKKPWRKILYEDQDYPDNYTDPTFLRDLRTSARYTTLRQAMTGTTVVLEELCTVTAFTLIYVYLFNEWTTPDTVLQWSSSLTAIGYILYLIKYAAASRSDEESSSSTTTASSIEDLHNQDDRLGHDLRTVLIFVVFGHLFSPVLHTLTDTVSTDTIYTMTFFMMLVHLIFFDYGIDAAAIVSNSLSVNAAVFASICLASRLSSAFHAFILITVAVEFFVLFPLLRNKVRKPIVISTVMLALNIYFTLGVSKLFLTLFVGCVLIVNVLCPMLFVMYQKHKLNIYGPWDEAVVKDMDGLFS